eukprot:3690207-Prymnesium_polylepis.1
MEDPELLAELAAVLGEDAPTLRAAKSPADVAAQRKSLESRVLAKKKQALAQKKAGDMKDATKLLREAKELEAQLQQLPAAAATAAPRAVAAPPQPAVPTNVRRDVDDIGDVQATEEDMEDPDLLAELAAVTGGVAPAQPAAVPSATAQREALQKEVLAAKREALQAKNAGNKVRAHTAAPIRASPPASASALRAGRRSDGSRACRHVPLIPA